MSGVTPDPYYGRGRPLPVPSPRSPAVRGRCATDRPPRGVPVKTMYYTIPLANYKPNQHEHRIVKVLIVNKYGNNE